MARAVRHERAAQAPVVLLEHQEGAAPAPYELTEMAGRDELVDDQTRILFANETAGRLFEFDANESRGRPLLSTIRDEVLRSSVQEAIESRRPVFNEIELRGPKTGTLAVRANPLPGEPCPGVVLVLDDRTELVRLESLRQEFVATQTVVVEQQSEEGNACLQ